MQFITWINRSRHFIKCYTKYKIYNGSANVHPFKLIYLNPKSIDRHYSNKPPFPNGPRALGYIKSGEWDHKDVEPLSQKLKFKAITERFFEQKSWDETELFDFFRKEFKEKTIVDECRDMKQLKERYSKIDKLYEKLRDEGYREYSHTALNYIYVDIDRHGGFIFVAREGAHRIALCQLLEIPLIPVMVRVRHTKWMEKRREVFEKIQSNKGIKTLRQDLVDHPDMQDLIRPDKVVRISLKKLLFPN